MLIGSMKSRNTLLVTLPLLLLACSGPKEPEVSEVHVHSAIVGGTQDDATKAVVGLGVGINLFFFGHCTGTLIAPNLVLTARHCVAMTQSPASGGVVCGQTPFTLQGPGRFFAPPSRPSGRRWTDRPSTRARAMSSSTRQPTTSAASTSP